MLRKKRLGEQEETEMASIGNYDTLCTLCSVFKWINIDQSKSCISIDLTLWWGQDSEAHLSHCINSFTDGVGWLYKADGSSCRMFTCV